jgi:hypothetical protein
MLQSRLNQVVSIYYKTVNQLTLDITIKIFILNISFLINPFIRQIILNV